ncbi:hypothetical protein, partial [Mycobacterium montefiorense]
ITQDVRDYAAKHGLETEEDIEAMFATGMAEKSAEFADHGNRVYLPITQ